MSELPTYSPYDPLSRSEFPPPYPYPQRFEDSAIASALARLEERLQPVRPGRISQLQRAARERYEEQLAKVKAWRGLRERVYRRVYRRTNDVGRQALQVELERITGLVMARQISTDHPVRLSHLQLVEPVLS